MTARKRPAAAAAGSAGDRLRAELDAALARAGDAAGGVARWDEREQRIVDAACRAADHVERLEALVAAEAAKPEPNGSVMVKAAAEIRQQDRHLTEALARLGDLGGQWSDHVRKSPRHEQMARARWGAARPVRRVK